MKKRFTEEQIIGVIKKHKVSAKTEVFFHHLESVIERLHELSTQDPRYGHLLFTWFIKTKRVSR